MTVWWHANFVVGSGIHGGDYRFKYIKIPVFAQIFKEHLSLCGVATQC